jgi:hypothetical protein
MEIYGAAVADKLDNNRGILRKRYYRQVSFYLFVIFMYPDQQKTHNCLEDYTMNILTKIGAN